MRRTCFHWLIIVYTLSFHFAFGQSKELLDEADKFIWNAEFQEAIDLIDRDINQNKDPKAVLVLKNKKADALIRMGKYQEAEILLTEIQKSLDDQDGDLIQRAIAQSNSGLLQLNLGRTDLAEEALGKAITAFEKSGKPGCLDAAQALSNLGLVYLNTGKYAQAEQQILMALSLRQKQLAESHELIAATYNDLGLVYKQIDPDKALDYYEKALAIYKKLYGNEHPKIAFVSINSGIIYRERKFYGDAVNNFEDALKIFDKVYPDAHPSKAIALYNLGQTYLQMDMRKPAMEYYQKALAMYEACYGNKHPELANVLNAIGNLQVAESEYDDALVSYQRAISANVADFNNDNVNVNPSLKNYYMGVRLLQSLLFKAQAFEARYDGKSLKFSDLTQALNILQRCDTLIDHLRQGIESEADKILLGVVANEVYADGVRISATTGINAFHKKQYYEQSFYFAEKSKNAVLLEAISESNAKSYAGIPEELLNKEKELKSAIALCARKLAQRPSPEGEKLLREESFTLNRNYEAFTKQLERDFPTYFNLKFNYTSPSIDQLQAILDDQTALLSYFIDEKNNRLYTFQVTQKKYTVEDHALPEDFNKNITGLRNSLFFNEQGIYEQTASALYKLLIPKHLPSHTSRLIILPTGRLDIIPFETLLIKPSAGQPYTSLPYLLRNYSVQYEFSAGLLLEKAKAKYIQPQKSILLCAPVHFPENSNLNDLPGTEVEVNEISDLFNAKHCSSKLFTGAEASETLLKTGDLQQYSYLHLATHGVVDENNPELSRIFLQPGSAGDDGNLFAGDIYNLKLRANLVTLSACQTGLGKISKGEGVIGLSRALVYAGAQNIIVSFWSVADESTSELMRNFYTELLSGATADYSSDLRKAKLALLSNDNYAAPYYWAPFVLIGF